MLLVADIGNTSTTLGVYKGLKLIFTWRIASENRRSADEYGILIKNLLGNADLSNKITGVIISSVVLPLTDVFKQAIYKYLGIEVIILSAKIKTGLKFNVENPKEVGADRIANAYAAYKLYGKDIAVVDFGTATTFDIVSKKGEFLGGIITPGPGIAAQSLNSFTSLLPKVNLEVPKTVVGKNTIDSMLSGLIRGHASMIDGMIDAVEQELGLKVLTIATGGYSKMLTDCLKRPFDIESPYLTLEGLRLIYEINK
ncbi:MAG: type III pantothenate kinase [Candidatus Gastranaerophilaceae bacterium]|jgi:type III pantothenate kinase